MNQQIAHNIENKPRTKDVHIIENVDFTALLLSDVVLQGLLLNGFKKPSPIQLKAIPMGRCGYDLIIQAKSGTGKTAVFGIIALEMIDVTKNQLQVLILAPTREIAVQIKDVLQSIGMNLIGLKVEYFIGGTSITDDLDKLKNCHIAVGAPGRVKHLIKNGHMKVESIRLFVLDEADKLLTDSQQKDINFIYNKLRATKQMIASSATYPGDLKQILKNYMHTPTIIDPHQDVPVLLGIRQFVTTVKSHLNVMQQMALKTEELIRIFQNVSFTQCIVFCNYQTRAETLCNTLCRQEWPTIYISAAQNQQTRLEAVTCLKEFKCRILSTTDLTARGIDAANVDLVINYEVPNDFETYLHRMGRAGRYGSSGLCISIVAEGAEVEKLQNIVGKIGSKLSVMQFPKENVPQDIWTCDIEQFEKLHGTVENKNDPEQICSTLKELSVGQDSSEEKKDEKEKCIESIIEVVQKERKTEIGDDVELLLQNLKKDEEITKETCKYQFNNMNPAAIWEMLSKGTIQEEKKEIDSPKENCEVPTTGEDLQEHINVLEMLSKINKEEETSKTEIKNKMSNLDPSTILNLIAQDKFDKSVEEDNCDDTIKKSKCKRIKRNKNNDKSSGIIPEDLENNQQFENEAKLFQENSIVHRNIALFNITKAVVDQESILDENVASTEKLLEIMIEEDNLEIKHQRNKLPFTEVLSQLGIKSEENQSSINNWEVVMSESKSESQNIDCTCSENLFCEVFDYAISRIDNHWQDRLCEYHKNIKTEEVDNKNEEEANVEYMDEDYQDDEEYYDENEEYYDENSEYYDENGEYYDENYEYYDDEAAKNEDNEEGMDTEVVYDENIFTKAYDYALNIEGKKCEATETANCEENEACGYAAAHSYDHLKTTKRRKRRGKKYSKAKAKLSQTEPKFTENESVESYYDYYDKLLAENGPYFTDVDEFEIWFKQWQDNVHGVTNYIHEKILAKEKLAKETSNS